MQMLKGKEKMNNYKNYRIVLKTGGIINRRGTPEEIQELFPQDEIISITVMRGINLECAQCGCELSKITGKYIMRDRTYICGKCLFGKAYDTLRNNSPSLDW